MLCDTKNVLKMLFGSVCPVSMNTVFIHCWSQLCLTLQESKEEGRGFPSFDQFHLCTCEFDE